MDTKWTKNKNEIDMKSYKMDKKWVQNWTENLARDRQNLTKIPWLNHLKFLQSNLINEFRSFECISFSWFVLKLLNICIMLIDFAGPCSKCQFNSAMIASDNL